MTVYRLHNMTPKIDCYRVGAGPHICRFSCFFSDIPGLRDVSYGVFSRGAESLGFRV